MADRQWLDWTRGSLDSIIDGTHTKNTACLGSGGGRLPRERERERERERDRRGRSGWGQGQAGMAYNAADKAAIEAGDGLRFVSAPAMRGRLECAWLLARRGCADLLLRVAGHWRPG